MWLAVVTRLSVALAVGVGIAAAQAMPIDRLVAVVEQRALTAGDLRLATRLSSIPGGAPDEAALVEQLVTRELVRAEADRFAVTPPSEASVDARMAGLASGQPMADWLADLEALGASADRVRRHVADDLRIAAYIDQRFAAAAQPTEAEVTARLGDTSDTPDARAAARRALIVERTDALVADWVAGLRRRASVRIVARP